jgi:phosphoglycolate phosphatase-like HAD superfamily hydrolase
MTSAALEAYVSRLERELRKRGVQDGRIVDEAREHLFDAVEDGRQRGLSVEAAEREALARFGPPEMVAAHFAAKRHRMSNWLFFILTRLAGVIRRNAPQAGHYHDVAVPSRYHVALRLRRPYRNRFQRMSADEQKRFIAGKRERGEDVGAFETDPRERLVQFLREFGRRTLGSGGTLESLTLLEDTTESDRRGGRYLVGFASGTKMIWTVALSGDGGVSFDGTNAPG